MSIRARALVVAMAMAVVSLVSCMRPLSKRYVTFAVKEVDIKSVSGTALYQPCIEIRGAKSGNILKRVAYPGDRILVDAGEDYDFRLIMERNVNWVVDEVSSQNYEDGEADWKVRKAAWDEWKAWYDAADDSRPEPPKVSDPGDSFDPEVDGVDYDRVVRLNSKTFRILEPTADDVLNITPSSAYRCVFILDKSSPGYSDQVDRVAFRMNDGNDAEYSFPLAMTFPTSGEVEHYQSAGRLLTFRLYMKPKSGYGISTVIKRRGSVADEILLPENNPDADGYYEYVISPEIESDRVTYSLDDRQVIITTAPIT